MVKASELVFKGTDSWDRPVYQDPQGKWYCCTDELLREDEATPEKLADIMDMIVRGRYDLCIKSGGRDGEPDWSVAVEGPDRRELDEKRQKIEREIVAAAADGLFAKGFLLSVFDGEEIVLNKSTSKDAVMEKMFSTGEDYFYVYTGDGQRAGFVRFVYGNDGWDVICDYSSNLEEALYEADKIAERYS